MIKKKVLLNEVEMIKSFVHCVSSRCESDVTLHSGRHYIDAKSLLGVFSLNLSQPVDIDFADEDDYKIIKDYMPAVFAA